MNGALNNAPERAIAARGWAGAVRRSVMVALLPAIVMVTSTVSVTDAQAADKAIRGLSLSSDSPGTIEVSWDEVKPTPTDHRVNWAKSNEDFPTWTDSDGNAFPPGTSYTISGLDEGVEYKVHVRARYSGESAGPWSAKVRIVVASQPAQDEDDVVSGDSDQVEEEEQQNPDKEIGGLTLSSDSPGTLQVSWDEVKPTPYRSPRELGQEQRGLPLMERHRGERLPGIQLPHPYWIGGGSRVPGAGACPVFGTEPGALERDGHARRRQPTEQAEEEEGTDTEGKPERPTGLMAVSTEDSVILTWDDPGDDSIERYLIYKKPEGNEWWTDYRVVAIVEPVAFSLHRRGGGGRRHDALPGAGREFGRQVHLEHSQDHHRPDPIDDRDNGHLRGGTATADPSVNSGECAEGRREVGSFTITVGRATRNSSNGLRNTHIHADSDNVTGWGKTQTAGLPGHNCAGRASRGVQLRLEHFLRPAHRGAQVCRGHLGQRGRFRDGLGITSTDGTPDL